MMLPVYIDPSDFVAANALTEREVVVFTTLLLDRLEKEFRFQWEQEIEHNLHRTRDEYMRGMFTERPDEKTIVMGVTSRESKLAVALELGKEPFDEKQGFMYSSKRHLKRGGGWYLTIPFRHAIPTSVGESSAFTSVLPMVVYRMALRAQDRPLTLRQLPPEHRWKGFRREIRREGRVLYPEYHHRSARYEGLIRVPDMAEGGSRGRGHYMTFRRVSDLSDANSWIHPGFVPRNFLRTALQKTDIPSVIRLAKIDFIQNR